MKRILLGPFSVLSIVTFSVSISLWCGVYPPFGVPHGVRMVTPMVIVEAAIEKAFTDDDGSYPGYSRIGFFSPNNHGHKKWGIARISRTQQRYDFLSGETKKLHQPIPRILRSIFGQHLCWGFPQASICIFCLWLVQLTFRIVAIKKAG